MKKILYAIILLTLLFAITACESEVKTEETQEEETQEEEETEEVQTQEEETETEEVEKRYNEFKNKLQNNPEYKVEYEITHKDKDKEVITIYTKDEKSRLDLKNEDVTAWLNGEKVVEYEGECIDLSTASNVGFNPEAIYDLSTTEGTLESEDKYISIDNIGTRDIAGTTVDCYEFIYDSDYRNEKTTFCLSDEGIPALIETKDRDTGELISKAEASLLEDSVSDEELKPCEITTDISGMI